MKVKQLLLLAATLVVLLIVTFVLGGKDKVVPLEPSVVQQATTANPDESTSVDTVNNATEDEVLESPIDVTSEEILTEAEPQTSSDIEEHQTDQQTEQPIVTVPSEEQSHLNNNDSQKPVSDGKPVETETPKPTQAQPSPKPTEIPKDSDSKTDQYMTDPVPAGKPQPVEWQDVVVDEKKTLKATLLVTAATILNNLHLFNEDKLEVLPSDGVIYAKKTVTFHEGESVFDVLLREMKNSKIHMEFVMTPIYNSHYVEGINNLYEFDCGELSGWMYKVNDWFPNYGASRYQLQSGDEIEWMYTCDLGRDIGGSGAVSANE